MEAKGQRTEDQFTTSQPSGGATSIDIQEVNQRRASSVASYGKSSNTGGPQVEERLQRPSTVNDPMSLMREDYLSRPSWLYDIGKYPMSLCPHVGEDGVPRRTSTGAPIFATEDRTVRRSSWQMDSGKCPHIVHYGAHRKSSTGAPIFALEEQNLRRASWFTTIGRYSTSMGSHTRENETPRRTSTGALVFATKDGNMHRPSWLTNTDKYPVTISPQIVEERAHRKSSAAVSVLAPEDGNLKRSSWVSDHCKAQNLVHPFMVEVRPNTHAYFEEGHSRHTPPAMIKEEEGPAVGVSPRLSPLGAPIADNLSRLSDMISNSNMLTTINLQAVDEAAPTQTSSGTFTSLLKERDVHRTLAMTNLPLLTVKCEVLQGQADALQGVETTTTTEQGKPRRAASTKSKQVTVSTPRDAKNPGISETAMKSLLEGPTVGFQSTRAKSGGHKVKLHWPSSISKSGSNTFRGQFIRDRSMTNWAAWKWSAASDTKPGRDKAPSGLSKNVRFDLRLTKDTVLPAARDKPTAEDTQPFQATTNIKKGKKAKSCPFMDNYAEFRARMNGNDNQTKQHKASSTLDTQLLEAQGFKLLHILLTRKAKSSQTVNGRFARNITTRGSSSIDDVKLGRSSSKITKGPKLSMSLKRVEDLTTKHLAVTEAIKDLQWYKADSPTDLVHKTSNLHRVKGKTTSPQTAKDKGPQAAKPTAVDIQAVRTNSTAEEVKVDEAIERPQSVEATAVDMQAAGTTSIAEVTTVDEATESITDQAVSPPKVEGQPLGVPHTRPNSSPEAKHGRPLIATKNVYLTINLQDPDTGDLDARSNLKTKEAKPFEDDSTTKLVCQTLHLGRVTLLPTTVNPEELTQQKAATSENMVMHDLGITGINLSRTHLQVDKLQQLTRSGRSEGPCPTPHSSSHALAVSPGSEHEDYKDIINEFPRSYTLSPNMKVLEQKKLNKLNDYLKGKMRESPRISMQGKRNRIQQNRKQLHEEPLFVKGHNTSFLEHSVTSNEPYRKKSAEPPKDVFEEYEMIEKKRKDSTSGHRKLSTDFKEQHLKNYKKLELDVRNKLSKPPPTFQLTDLPAIDIQESEKKKPNKHKAVKMWNVSSEFIQQRKILQKEVNELDTMHLRDNQLRPKKQKPLGFVKADPYKDFHVITDKEKQRKTHKLVFLPKS